VQTSALSSSIESAKSPPWILLYLPEIINLCATSLCPLISKLEAVRVNSPVDVSLEYDKSLVVESLFLTMYWTPSIIIVLVSPPAKASAPSRADDNAFAEKETAERAAALPAGFLDIVSSLFVLVVLPLFSR